jgi:soluble lytic murein transglycosylase
MKGKDIDRVATLYSIARQESRFIPSAISTSYALGFMQIMPFLAEHIAKELKMNISLDDMLRPEISIKFADYHLDHDLRSLKHPLLVAYAYNAGIGFTRKTIKAGAFQTKNRFEPFWSMEFIPYAETRKYGKKVLANYIVYKKLLGESIQPTTILQSVIPYSQTLYAKK